jgi:hypothetical protein
MSKNLVEVDAFTTPVTVPEDGDAATGAAFEAPYQALADRTVYNKTRIDTLMASEAAHFPGGNAVIAGQYQYASPKTITRMVSPDAFQYDSSVWKRSGQFAESYDDRLAGNGMTVALEGELVDGATLTNVVFRAIPSNDPGGTSRLNFTLQKIDSSGNATQIGTTQYVSGTSSTTVTLSGSGEVIAKGTYTYRVAVSGNTAAAGDRAFAAVISMSVSELRVA